MATRLSFIEGPPPFGQLNSVESAFRLSTTEVAVEQPVEERVGKPRCPTLKCDVNDAGIRHQSRQLAPNPAIAYAVTHGAHDLPGGRPIGVINHHGIPSKSDITMRPPGRVTRTAAWCVISMRLIVESER